MKNVQLYYSPSTASLVVHWLLIELGVAHELIRLDFNNNEQKTPAYLKLNPMGVVPTLVVDGNAISESAAIIMHLADSFPERNLAPALGSIERAHCYQWLHHCTNQLQPAYRAWFYSAEPAGEANANAAKLQAQQKLEMLWDKINQHLVANGPYLLGSKLSVADFMLTMLMRWSRNMPKPADTWPANAAHAKLMKAMSSFAECYVREGISDWR
jgi:glutathione S-transferase